jgi:Glycosyltransferase sugar-binding region containing DXD motif
MSSLTPTPPFVLQVPIDDVGQDPLTGRDRVLLDGKALPVAYDADLGCWRLTAGQGMNWRLDDPVWRVESGGWRSGSFDDFARAPVLPSAIQTVSLPPVPALPNDARPVPRTIHYIWIGEAGMPEDLAANIRANASRSGAFSSVVHVHAESAPGMAKILAQLGYDPNITVSDLREEAFFAEFMGSTLAGFYRYFNGESGRNHGAASDILRVRLMHHYGGIYLDVDDALASTPGADAVLLAGPDDLLLNNMVVVAHYGFHGYCSSNFACHPGNPVLEGMAAEMERRLVAERTFFDTPRPWRHGDMAGKNSYDDPSMLAYILEVFRLTGPLVFNDVLREMRPDCYWIEQNMLAAYLKLNWSPAEPRYVANAYMDRMQGAKEHYLPFAEGAFAVRVGSAHSWNPTVAAPTDGPQAQSMR